MTERDNNTVTAYHINNGNINTDKIYKWHIPKKMRVADIQSMDIVKVSTMKGKADVIIIEAFRENIEDTGISHRSIIGIVNSRGRKTGYRKV